MDHNGYDRQIYSVDLLNNKQFKENAKITNTLYFKSYEFYIITKVDGFFKAIDKQYHSGSPEGQNIFWTHCFSTNLD